MELANCQITLNGLFGEISDARKTKIQAHVGSLFPTVLEIPAGGILAFTNPMTQEVLVIGPSAFNYTAAKTADIKIEKVRELYEALFKEGLLAETVTPTLEIGSLVDVVQPLRHLQKTAGGAFDAGFKPGELFGMAVRKLYRHDGWVVEVRLENNFQGQDRYHGAVRIQSESPYPWRNAFDKLASALQLAENVSTAVDASLAIVEVSA